MQHILKIKTLLVCAALAVPASIAMPDAATALSRQEYCQNRAQQLSGYRGSGGKALRGAIRGAVGGAVITGILGGDSRDRRRAAGIGAVIGGVSGAQRPNSRAARIYRLEYENCMRRR